MRDSGITLLQINEGGVTSTELLDAGFTIAQMRDSGITLSQINEGGVTLSQINEGGVTLLQINEGGVTSTELLDAGFTIAQMRDSGITLSQIRAGGIGISAMRSAGIADYLLFNEVCNTPRIVRGKNGFLMRLLSTNLAPTDTQVVLGAESPAGVRWTAFGAVTTFTSSSTVHTTNNLGSARAVYLGVFEGKVTSILITPLSNVFSNPRIEGRDSGNFKSISLCPNK